jgi:hypothetical protein
MGEGPGKKSGIDLIGENGNSQDTTEKLATDSGSGILAILGMYILFSRHRRY